MGLFSNREKATGNPRADAIRSVVASDKFKPLGTLRGQLFAIHNGVEFAVDGGAGVADAADLPLHSGDLVYAVRGRDRFEDGTEVPSTRYRRATPVPAGTYAGLVARQEARRPASARARLVDVLRVFSALRGRQEVVIPGPARQPTIDGDMIVVRPDHFGNKPSTAAYFPPTPGPQTPAEVIAECQRQEFVLKPLPGDRIYAVQVGTRRMSRDLLHTLKFMERALALELTGRWPDDCEQHPELPPHPATKVLVPSGLGCDQ